MDERREVSLAAKQNNSSQKTKTLEGRKCLKSQIGIQLKSQGSYEQGMGIREEVLIMIKRLKG